MATMFEVGKTYRPKRAAHEFAPGGKPEWFHFTVTAIDGDRISYRYVVNPQAQTARLNPDLYEEVDR